MQVWKAHYKDALHDTDIRIVNTEGDYNSDPLSFILDGAVFRGASLDELHSADDAQHSLRDFSLEAEIPVKVFRRRDEVLLEGTLFAAFQKSGDDVTVNEFSLLTDGKRYKSARRTLCFELTLIDICRQIKEEYYIKCCFTCQYSDYSPYGSADYGFMLCFRRHKEDCLRVNSKDDFFAFLDGKDFDGRQETYLCGQYSLRNKAGGYRGFVDGAEDWNAR